MFLVSLIPNKSYNLDGPNTNVLTVDITNANKYTYFRSEKCQKFQPSTASAGSHPSCAQPDPSDDIIRHRTGEIWNLTSCSNINFKAHF